MDRLRYVVNIIVVVLLFASISIQRDGRLLGEDISQLVEQKGEIEDESSIAVERHLSDGVVVVNSTTLATDIIGYGGRTPIELTIRDGIVEKIDILPNSETPSFQENIINSGFIDRLLGLSVEDVAKAKIDAVSGATYSSGAFAENIRRASRYASNLEVASHHLELPKIEANQIIALAVILLALILTINRSRNRALRIVQLVLNVSVLGFWCGSFLSLTTFVSWIGNGFNLSLGIASVAMLLFVVVLPLFNYKGSYCATLCPMGSAQELMGLIPIKRVKISPTIQRWLNRLRYYILLALLTLMWVGLGFEGEKVERKILSHFFHSGAAVSKTCSVKTCTCC